ncbi:hypothetical protein ACFVXC_40310 [Streptomyces sp. NPDC058257]|uniref:hypothetical protein n=1 Tax=Streptomyces sp. NPDC058257 TaxID=3346409 RepID=UPI0036EF8D3C
MIVVPIVVIALFFVWTLLPITLPRSRLGTWLTAAHPGLSLTAILMVWIADPSSVPGVLFLVGLGGLFAALRLLLQRAFADSSR